VCDRRPRGTGASPDLITGHGSRLGRIFETFSRFV
jgi:hypothetical protein